MKISSSAFPEQKEPQIFSQVHQLLQKYLEDHPAPTINIRQYRSSDLEQLQKLQRQWFPLNYSNDFYNRVINGTAICCIAEAVILVQGKEMAVIVGAVIFEYSYDSEDLEVGWWSHMFAPEANSLYIMTLGVVDQLRSTGLAKRLLEQTLIFAQNHAKIKMIQLHVVAYNRRAIKFYKRNNFLMLDYLEDHYHILGKEYDGLKLGIFVNEGKRRQKWKPWFRRVILRRQEVDEWPV